MKLVCLWIVALAALCQEFAEKGVKPVTVAAKRALVIGNGNYLHMDRIPQALNDADDMKATLESQGVLVTLLKNIATLDELTNAISVFTATIQSNDLVFVYYSGHGGMVEGENYLLPLNFQRPPLPHQVVQRAFRMSDLKRDMEGSAARVRVLIFDACRNRSLVAEKSGDGSGFAALSGRVEGTLIAYAADEGRPALYNPQARNSYFTAALKRYLGVRGLHLKEALERTQLRVFVDTQQAQRPYLSGFLTGPVFLTPPSSIGSSSDVNLCGDAWGMVRNSSDTAALQAFTIDFPECTDEIRLARLQMGTLERRSEPVVKGARVNPVDGQRYVWVPAGQFQMGCSPGDQECLGNEKPVQVTLSSGFWMGETEVTQGAYERVMRANPSRFKGVDRPVDAVHWEQSTQYCQKVGGRLPTEAEWEWAARGGRSQARYGNVDSSGWFSQNSGGEPHAVGKKQANRYGLYDMLGNVWEWTADWYGHDLAGGAEPRGPDNGTAHVLRGGSWFTWAWALRASNRHGTGAANPDGIVGFRCVWD